jgi:hypothetical protein
MILVSEPAAVKVDVRAVEVILMTLVVCLAHPELICTFSASAQTENDVSRFKDCPDKIVRDNAVMDEVLRLAQTVSRSVSPTWIKKHHAWKRKKKGQELKKHRALVERWESSSYA